MAKAESIKLLESFDRASKNGKETQVCIRYQSKTYYSWVLIRYNTVLEPEWHDSEIIQDFAGYSWDEIAAYVQAYLADHVDDGFYWN